MIQLCQKSVLNSIYGTWPIRSYVPNVPESLEDFQGVLSPQGMILIYEGQEDEKENLDIKYDYTFRAGFGLGYRASRSRKKTVGQYLILRKGEQKWLPLGKMLQPRYYHSSVFMKGSIFSCGGFVNDHVNEPNDQHEEFHIDSKVAVWKKSLPVALQGHTAEQIDQNRYMVIGGQLPEASKMFRISNQNVR